ncbi:MAG: glycosyltransferase [Actinomycetota bacterium]|nr:glycosyltransferase [Actinomycetota bacterium]
MPPDVSVVVLNFNGKPFLDACLESLFAQSYPAPHVEILLVDNGSSDGSLEYVRSQWPRVRTLPLETNRGFAGGINAGVRAAKGRYVALINNDAKAHADWIRNGLAGFGKSMDVAMVASKILTLDGKTMDYAGGALTFYGHGFKVGVNEPDEGQYDRPIETLFGSGCALFMPRDLFLEVGGFDEDYFAFFEDVDLGWRLWTLGYRVLYEPSSVVYHRHHGTADALGQEKERFLLERNALITILKNYETKTLEKVLGPSVMLAVERGLTYSHVERTKYDLAAGVSPPVTEQEGVSPVTVSHLLAVSEVCRSIPQIMAKREVVQSRRRRSDSEILPLFKTALVPNIADPEFAATFMKLVSNLELGDTFRGRTKVLVITGDTVSSKMAGPAIRAWEICSELAAKHDVRMLTRSPSEMQPRQFRLEVLSEATLPEYLDWADVVIFQGFIMHAHKAIARCGKVLVADLYDPFHLENLEMFREDQAERRLNIAESDLEVINHQLRICDYFICASEKQRDFWLGQLAGIGRLNPHVYDLDPTLRGLIDVVPFGIPSDPPLHTRNVLKGVVPGIEPHDKVILWGGGIYNWFDPLTLIRAVDQVVKDHPEVKLFFMGLAHPNPDVPEMRMANAARKLAASLGLEGRHVFFNTDWVPYDQRANYLLESDIGVSCHLEHIETTYSYRTRVLDYFWAEIPVIVTRGDALSELVEERALGLTVGPGDVDGFAEAITRLIEDESLARESKLNVGKLRPELAWGEVIKPLDRFCSYPRRAPDNLQFRSTRHRINPVRRLAGRMVSAWQEGGPTLVISRTAGYIARPIRKRQAARRS